MCGAREFPIRQDAGNYTSCESADCGEVGACDYLHSCRQAVRFDQRQLSRKHGVVVEGERIKSVETASNVQIPAGAKVIDLSKATVLPGLIDCHTHLGARADRYNPINAFKETPYTQGFAAEKNARTTLLAGFTTVRDVGSGPFMAVDLRNSINEGYIVGPTGGGQRSGNFDHRRTWRPEQLLSRNQREPVSGGARLSNR